jgi:hypothetical protein
LRLFYFVYKIQSIANAIRREGGDSGKNAAVAASWMDHSPQCVSVVNSCSFFFSAASFFRFGKFGNTKGVPKKFEKREESPKKKKSKQQPKNNLSVLLVSPSFPPFPSFPLRFLINESVFFLQTEDLLFPLLTLPSAFVNRQNFFLTASKSFVVSTVVGIKGNPFLISALFSELFFASKFLHSISIA